MCRAARPIIKIRARLVSVWLHASAPQPLHTFCHYIKKKWINLCRTVGDLLAACLCFAYLQTWLTVIVVAVSVGGATFSCLYKKEPGPDGKKTDLAAYMRRESALDALAQVKSSLFSLFLFHLEAVGDAGNGTAREEKAAVLEMVDEFLLALGSYLTSTKVRLRTTKARRLTIINSRETLRFQIASRLIQLQNATRFLRAAKVSVGELARVHQWNQGLSYAVERLALIKEYRLPQGVRAFSRFFALAALLAYGPYYGYIYQTTGSLEFALCFAGFVGLGVSAILNEGLGLEDPFQYHALNVVNDVRVWHDLESFSRQLRVGWSAEGSPDLTTELASAIRSRSLIRLDEDDGDGSGELPAWPIIMDSGAGGQGADLVPTKSLPQGPGSAHVDPAAAGAGYPLPRAPATLEVEKGGSRRGVPAPTGPDGPPGPGLHVQLGGHGLGPSPGEERLRKLRRLADAKVESIFLAIQ